MSGSNPGTSWAYSQTLRAYYYHDRARNVYILADGQVVPAPSVQAAPSVPAPSLPASSQANQRQSPANISYTVSPRGATTTTSNLTQRLANIALENSGAQGSQRRRGGSNAAETREDLAPPVVRAHDPSTQVTTVIQRAPSQSITDPSLFAVGVGAHRRLLPSDGDEEAFDPGGPHLRPFRVERG